MESVFAQVVLPIILAVIMFGMGLSLSRRDFMRLMVYPRSIGLGILGQIILLPFLAFAVTQIFNLSSSLAIGMMILAACPGGTMSNVVSQLARANLALSVTLTAISTLICVFTTPFIIQFAITYFENDQAQSFSLGSTVLGLVLVTLIPVTLGLIVHEMKPEFARTVEPYLRKLSLAFLLVMVVLILYADRDTLMQSLGQVFFSALCLNIAAIGLGYILGLVGRCQPADTATLGIEVGIQNSTLAILIAVSFLGKPEYGTAGGVYGLAMYLGTIPLILWSLHKQKRANMSA